MLSARSAAVLLGLAAAPSAAATIAACSARASEQRGPEAAGGADASAESGPATGVDSCVAGVPSAGDRCDVEGEACHAPQGCASYACRSGRLVETGAAEAGASCGVDGGLCETDDPCTTLRCVDGTFRSEARLGRCTCGSACPGPDGGTCTCECPDPTGHGVPTWLCR